MSYFQNIKHTFSTITTLKEITLAVSNQQQLFNNPFGWLIKCWTQFCLKCPTMFNTNLYQSIWNMLPLSWKQSNTSLVFPLKTLIYKLSRVFKSSLGQIDLALSFYFIKVKSLKVLKAYVLNNYNVMHVMQGGGQKSGKKVAKKCQVLFAWPLSQLVLRKTKF